MVTSNWMNGFGDSFVSLENSAQVRRKPAASKEYVELKVLTVAETVEEEELVELADPFDELMVGLSSVAKPPFATGPSRKAFELLRNRVRRQVVADPKLNRALCCEDVTFRTVVAVLVV